MHLSLTEDITVAVQRAVTSQVVDTTSATIHVAVNLTTIHLDIRLARTIDTFQR